jgi:hypothetical protein
MLRSTSSLVVILATMAAAPAVAADMSDWGVDYGSDTPDFRSGYPTEPGDWAGLGDKDDPLQFEFGIRYWYSMGAVSASSGGGAVSATDTSHIGELHLRIEDHSTNTFAKAIAGYSIASSGSFTSPSGAGAIVDGHVGYLGADFGWHAFGDHNGSGVGLLVGYQYWNEALNTGRTNYTTATASSDIAYDPATGQTFLPGDSVANSIDVHALRLGASGKVNLGDYFDISAEVAAVPYAKVSGTVGIEDPAFDTSVYGGPAQVPYGGVANGNISTMRASPTTLDGWGYGAMAEGWIGVHPTQNLTMRLGGRAWYLQGSADATYSVASVGNPSDGDIANPPNFDTAPAVSTTHVINTTNPFSLFRYGIMGEITYSF